MRRASSFFPSTEAKSIEKLSVCPIGSDIADAGGMALQINYLPDKGAFTIDSEGMVAVRFGKVEDAVQDLTRELPTLEATGDYTGAKRLLETLAVIRPNVQKAIDKLQDIPTDIEPVFVTENEL